MADHPGRSCSEAHPGYPHRVPAVPVSERIPQPPPSPATPTHHHHCNSDPIECNVEASMAQIEEALRVLTYRSPFGHREADWRIKRAVDLLRTVRLPDAPKEGVLGIQTDEVVPY